MTTIRFIDGKPILRDGKVSTNDECCVCPACCQHYCNKMCCNQVKWVVPGYTDSFTSVGPADCRAVLHVPEAGLQIRVRVRCGGYVHRFPVDAPWWWPPQYQDCDTDCEIVEVEYSEDGGTTWTTTPPESAAGITWSIYCGDGGEQPAAQASAQRCAALTATNQQTCENELDGEFCNIFTQAQEPCPTCALPCGPEPTEWRLVGTGGLVWFSGDVIPNPLYTGEGEALCFDPCSPSFPTFSASPRWLLKHFPLVDNYCSYTPAGWPTTEGSWLHLEVLGCGGGWQRVGQWCGCHTIGDGYQWDFPVATNPCNVSDTFWSGVGTGLGNGDGFGITLQSPPGCACLRDPATGDMVGHTDNTYGYFCCPTCNHYLGATGCSTGLEYLDHGYAVRFTGTVDNEGSNLWNWQDSESESPAGFWPSGAITIAGELRSWRGGTAYGWNYHPDWSVLSFPSVTLEPGAVLAISLTTETLTVDDAKIEELMLVSGFPNYCGNGGFNDGRGLAVGINVTGTATFKNGAENHAVGGVTGGFELTPFAGITGNCVFESGSKNFGTIAGNCDFSDNASNEGTITGDCTFTDTAANNDTITGNCTFSGDAVNNGTITGDATFSGNAVNAGTVTGNCTFSGNATNTGTVDGDATFANSSYTSDPTIGGVITGTITFSSETPVTFVISGSSVWSADTSAWVFTTSGQNWTFNGSSSNTGAINGDATFSGTASMAGNVTGTATFNDDACWSSGTAGTFDPDPPPAC